VGTAVGSVVGSKVGDAIGVLVAVGSDVNAGGGIGEGTLVTGILIETPEQLNETVRSTTATNITQFDFFMTLSPFDLIAQ